MAERTSSERNIREADRFDALFDAYWLNAGRERAGTMPKSQARANRRLALWPSHLDDCAEKSTSPGLPAAADGGDGTSFGEETGRLVATRNEALMHRDLRELSDLGLEVRDLELGLVDFPSLIDGEPAYLSWRLGEEDVSWWHPADKGFSDRAPVPLAVGTPPAL